MYFPSIKQRTIMSILKTTCITVAAIVLSNCGTSGKTTIEVKKTSGYQANHGPFDSNGNYVESWADNPPRRVYVTGYSKKSTSTAKKKTTYTPPQKKTYTPPKKTYTPPKKTYTPPKKKPYTPPKKKPTKVTPKSKPPVTHIVKKGDTLYGLSRRYGSSVSAIQKANKLSGTNIRLGQRLIIPRK